MPLALRSICDLTHRWSPQSWAKLACLAAVLVAVVGCGKSTTVPNGDESEKLRQIIMLYSQFAAANNDTGPADEAMFRQYISQQSEGRDIDAMLVSERDNQPYVILYGKHLTMSFEQNAPPDIVVYEKEGVGGGRYLGAADGEIGIVDEAKFKELVPE